MRARRAARDANQVTLQLVNLAAIAQCVGLAAGQLLVGVDGLEFAYNFTRLRVRDEAHLGELR